jgi:hypothetical protein
MLRMSTAFSDSSQALKMKTEESRTLSGWEYIIRMIMFMDDWTRQDAFWTLRDGARDEMLRIVSTRMTKKDVR